MTTTGHIFSGLNVLDLASYIEDLSAYRDQVLQGLLGLRAGEA